MTYPQFAGGTAATVDDALLTPATTLAYPPGTSPNDLIIVQASWADRTYMGPPPERTFGDGDPHGFIYDYSGNFQSTRSLRFTTRLGSNLPMVYRPGDDAAELLGHFITFRLWSFRHCGTSQLYVGGNVFSDGSDDEARFLSSGIGGGTSGTDNLVIFGLALNPLTRYVDSEPTFPPTPLRPSFTLASWSSNLVDLRSLNEIGADEPLGHAAWIGGIPAGTDLTVSFDVRIAGIAGQWCHFQQFLYYFSYLLDPDAPPIGSCPPRQAATAGATTLRVRANA